MVWRGVRDGVDERRIPQKIEKPKQIARSAGDI
jgi:hypothetical protein